MTHTASLFAMFFDGDVAGVFNSPYIVPVFGTIMILGIVVAGIWSGVRRREMESAERLAAIAKGVTLPPTPEELALTQMPRPVASSSRQRSGVRTAGLVLTFLGIGLGIFGVVLTWIVGDRDVYAAAAAGLIPLAIGVGFLIDAHLKSRDLQRQQEADGSTSLSPLH